MNIRPIAEDDLHAFVDGRLDTSRAADVAIYLTSHPEAAQRVEDYRRQRQLLRAALESAAEEPVPAELNLARMIEARRRPSALSWWRAAAAAMLLLGIGGAAGWSLHGATQPAGGRGIAALAQEAADSYAVYASDHQRPVELRTADQAELVDWATHRLNSPVAVPDLAAAGFRFMGGRMVATPHGPAVLFMYDDDRGTRLVMLSRGMAVDRDAPMQGGPMTQHAYGAVVGYTWAERGLGYSLVGPIPAERLHPLADEVRRQVGSRA